MAGPHPLVLVSLIAVGLSVWAVSLHGLFRTDESVRWQARVFRRFPAVCWPFPPAWVERYLLSRYNHRQTQLVGGLALAASTLILVLALLAGIRRDG
jgi:hypothetical protein